MSNKIEKAIREAVDENPDIPKYEKDEYRALISLAIVAYLRNNIGVSTSDCINKIPDLIELTKNVLDIKSDMDDMNHFVKKRNKIRKAEHLIFDVLNKSDLTIEEISWLLLKILLRSHLYDIRSDDEIEEIEKARKRTCLKCGEPNSLDVEFRRGERHGDFSINLEGYWKCSKCGWEYKGNFNDITGDHT